MQKGCIEENKNDETHRSDIQCQKSFEKTKKFMKKIITAYLKIIVSVEGF